MIMEKLVEFNQVIYLFFVDFVSCRKLFEIMKERKISEEQIRTHAMCADTEMGPCVCLEYKKTQFALIDQRRALSLTFTWNII